MTATEPGSDTLILALDATFVRKSGKQTFGLGRFWGGTAERVERGLEVLLVAVVNVTTKTAYALEAEQTALPPPAAQSGPNRPTTTTTTTETLPAPVAEAEQVTRVDAYLTHLTRTKPNWPPQVRYLVADGFYTKQKFVTRVCDLGLHMVGKLWADAKLRFPYTGPQKPRGRRRIYDGKVDLADHSSVPPLGEVQPKVCVFTTIVFHVSLKRLIRLVVLVNHTVPDKLRFVLLFSTDNSRAAKQVTSLTHCQSHNQQLWIFISTLASPPSISPKWNPHPGRRPRQRLFLWHLTNAGLSTNSALNAVFPTLASKLRSKKRSKLC